MEKIHQSGNKQSLPITILKRIFDKIENYLPVVIPEKLPMNGSSDDDCGPIQNNPFKEKTCSNA